MAATDELLPTPTDADLPVAAGPAVDWDAYYGRAGTGSPVSEISSAATGLKQGLRQGVAGTMRNLATAGGLPQPTQDYFKEIATEAPGANAPGEITNPDSVATGVTRGIGRSAPMMAASLLPGGVARLAMGYDAAQGAKLQAQDLNAQIDAEIAHRQARNPNDPAITILQGKKLDPATASFQAVATMEAMMASGKLLQSVSPAIKSIESPAIRGLTHAGAETGINLLSDLGIQAATNPTEFADTVSDPVKLAEHAGAAAGFGAMGGTREFREARHDLGVKPNLAKVNVGEGFDVPPPLPEPPKTVVDVAPATDLNPLTTAAHDAEKKKAAAAEPPPLPLPAMPTEAAPVPPPLPEPVLTPNELAFRERAAKARKNLKAASTEDLARMFEENQNPAERALIQAEIIRRHVEPDPAAAVPEQTPSERRAMLQAELGNRDEAELTRIQELAQTHNWSDDQFDQALTEALLKRKPPELPKPDEQKGSTQEVDVQRQAEQPTTKEPDAVDQVRQQQGNTSPDAGAVEPVRGQRVVGTGTEIPPVQGVGQDSGVGAKPDANVKVRRQGKQRAGAKKQPVLAAPDQILPAADAPVQPNKGSLAANPAAVVDPVEAALARKAKAGKKIIPKREIADIEADLEELAPGAAKAISDEAQANNWDEKTHKTALNKRLYAEQKDAGLVATGKKGADEQTPKPVPLTGKAKVAEPAKKAKAPKKTHPGAGGQERAGNDGPAQRSG